MEHHTLMVWSIAILTGLATMLLGAAVLLRRRDKQATDLARRRAMQDFDTGQGPGRDAGDGDTARPRLLFTVQRAGEIVGRGRASRGLREKLASAGYHGHSASSIYLGAKVLLFGAGVAFISLLVVLYPGSLGMPTVYLLTALTGGVFFFIPDLAVGIARDRRRKEIRRHLPDAVDLIEICVSAGLGLDQSWNSVAEEIRRVCPMLADEMELTNLEISLGASRAVAMRHMAERTGAEDISSLVALLVQSERFGASIVDALRTFATTMRETWSRRAEEGAEKMAVKMLFPMALFIFPAILIVLMGPAVLDFFQAMGSH